MTDATDVPSDQCKRCGSTLSWEDCATCEACGGLDPYTGFGHLGCPTCNGSGRMPVCISSQEWCEAHPLPGREDVQRHTPEEFTIGGPGEAARTITRRLRALRPGSGDGHRDSRSER